MRILHVNGFSDTERKQKIEDIKKNIRDAILVSRRYSNVMLLHVDIVDMLGILNFMKKKFVFFLLNFYRRLQVL